MKRLLLSAVIAAIGLLQAFPLEITRYVREGANGQGLSPEAPSGDLKAVLGLSHQVDALTVYLSPGTYDIGMPPDPDSRFTCRNVTIYGGWTEQGMDSDVKSVITGDLVINGGEVYNINFRHGTVGNSAYDGMGGCLELFNADASYVNATRLSALAGEGAELRFYKVHSPEMYIGTRRTVSRRLPAVILTECVFANGAATGLSASGVRIIANRCRFADNRKGGMSIDRCSGSYFYECRFTSNQGKGGIYLYDLTDDISARFERCVISNNTTSDRNRAAAISTGAPIIMSDCLVAGNYSLVEDRSLNPHQGAIELGRNQSRFFNCTFAANHCVLFYSMYPSDQSMISDPQFVNCLFLKNRLSYISVHGEEPRLYNCAADFGSGIPELDAERGLISVTPESAGVDLTDNEAAVVLEGSPLINKGTSVNGNDLDGINRQMLGATDIGCCEYRGIWHPVPDAPTVTIGDVTYMKAFTEYGGQKFQALCPSDYYNEELGVVSCGSGMIYLGDNIADFRKLDEANVLTFMTVDGKKTAMLQSLYGSTWSVEKVMPYTSLAPKAVSENGRWTLKEATPARKTGGTSSARKRTRR